jgi:hypothetical protein
MKQIKAIGSLLLCAVMLAGCASGPKYLNVQSSIHPIPANHGRIFFYRPSFMGFGTTPIIGVNGRPICKTRAYGCFYADCEPGECEINKLVGRRVSVDGQPSSVVFSPGGTLESPYVAVKLLVKAGETRYVKIKMNNTFFYIMDKDVAEKEIQGCKLQEQYGY